MACNIDQVAMPHAAQRAPTHSQLPQGPAWQTSWQVWRPQSSARPHTRPHWNTPCLLQASCAASVPQQQRTSDTRPQGGQGPCGERAGRESRLVIATVERQHAGGACNKWQKCSNPAS